MSKSRHKIMQLHCPAMLKLERWHFIDMYIDMCVYNAMFEAMSFAAVLAAGGFLCLRAVAKNGLYFEGMAKKSKSGKF